jgi:hypothetical protein
MTRPTYISLFYKHAKRETELFKKCLENNRPTFIDFFLSAGFDPRELSTTKRISDCEQIIWELYTQSRQLMSEVSTKHHYHFFN